MSLGALATYLDHIPRAATDASDFIEGMSKDEFLTDRRTRNAVVMCLIVIGEAATKLMDRYPDFAVSHPHVPWRSMRGMRNRIARGYFDVVWETVETALPVLLEHLPVSPDASGGNNGGNHD